MDNLCYVCLVFVMLSRLFIAALWSPAGKGLTSWLLFVIFNYVFVTFPCGGAQWLSGRVLDSRPRGRGFEPHRRYCVVVLEQDLVLVQPRKTRPCLTERLLMRRKKSIKTNKHFPMLYSGSGVVLNCNDS